MEFSVFNNQQFPDHFKMERAFKDAKVKGWINFIWRGSVYSTEITCGDGSTVRPGDYVSFTSDHTCYGSNREATVILYGKRRRVQNIVDGRLEVFINSNHPINPLETTFVSPTIVRCSGRQSVGFIPYSRYGHPKEENNMLYVAIKLPRDANYQRVSDLINSADSWAGIRENVMSDTNENALKEKVRQAIARDPEDSWLMLHGNILARAEHPPVRFSQW